jgi:hypothetical protein
LYNQDIENWGKYRISSDEKETKMKANQEKMFAMLKNCDTDSEMNKVNDLRKLCQTYSDQIEEYKTTHAQEKNRLASENSSLSQEVKRITIENQECLNKAKDSGDIAQELERQLLDVLEQLGACKEKHCSDLELAKEESQKQTLEHWDIIKS